MSNTPFPVMMFAAGFGTRMKELTQDRPKPLIQIAGKPLIDHALALARDVEGAPIVVNLHHKAEMLEKHLHPLGVSTVTEAPKILETGGGLRNALPLLGPDPVITMNTDAIWAGPNPVQILIDAWRPQEMDALLICVPPASAIGHAGGGDFILTETGRIERGPDVVYGGIQILKTELLAQVTEQSFSLNVIWDMMLATGRLFGVPYPGKWCDVGHPGGIKLAEEMLEQSGV